MPKPIRFESELNNPSQHAGEFREVDAETFIKLRENSKFTEFLTPYTAREMDGWKHFMTDDGVGFTLTDKMDMIGGINNSGRKGARVDAIIEAIARGGKTLDSIDGFLSQHYKDFGFVEKKRMAWDDRRAPKGWSYGKYGRPVVVFFEYPEGLSRDREDVRRRFEAATSGKSGCGRQDTGPCGSGDS